MRVLKGWIVVLLVVLSACAALGLAPPQTFNQRLLYAYGGVTSTRLAAVDLLNNGSITVDNAKDVQSKADTARDALDAARVAGNKGDTTTAESKLLSAKNILDALQMYLKAHGGKI